MFRAFTEYWPLRKEKAATTYIYKAITLQGGEGEQKTDRDHFR